ncbi:MAG: precorrin-2 C(20)-methyltransferase, partial [Alphaproteobacteria bacterium]
MTAFDAIAGTARAGTLYGIGVGPGDVRYLTLRAAALVRDVDVLAFFAKRGLQGNARGTVDPLLAPGRTELRLEYPVTDEIPPEHPSYQKQLAHFYEE